MNHIQILKRAWTILWSYKTLWVFGILFALTTAEGFNAPNNGSRVTVSPETQQWRPIPAEELQGLPQELGQAAEDLNRELADGVPQEWINTLIGITVALVCLALVLAVVSAFVHYVSQTALIRMTDRYEASGEKVNWRTGFRLGWSRPAWRIFLIDVLLSIAMFVIVVLLFAFAAVPAVLSILLGGLAVFGIWAAIAGTLMTVGLGMLAVFATIVMGAVLAMVREVVYRECVLRGRGVLDSIGFGLKTLRANFKDVFLLWLLLLALQIVYFIAAIPAVFILLAMGLVIGGVAGALLYLALQAGSMVTAVIVAVIVGVLLLSAVVGIPMTFLRGLRETYLSTAWTLGYREIPAPAPVGNGS
jgi:hypothetical protein